MVKSWISSIGLDLSIWFYKTVVFLCLFCECLWLWESGTVRSRAHAQIAGTGYRKATSSVIVPCVSYSLNRMCFHGSAVHQLA